MENNTKVNIEKAVNWWSDKINNPKFDNGTEEQGGSPLAGILMLMNASLEQSPSEDSIKVFKEKLAIRIEEKLAVTNQVILDVDYNPCGILSDAADEAGIRNSFPWKTTMWITKDSVKVRYGYGAPIETL